MKRTFLVGILALVISALVGCGQSKIPTPSASPSPSPFNGIVYQDFEGSDQMFSTEAWGLWGATAKLTTTGKYVKTGSKALEITTSSDSAGGLKVISKNGWSINLNPTSNHNLSFWIYAEPVSQNYHGMKIAFKENPDSTGDYQEYWTDVNVAGQKFVADTWTKISIPLSNFTNINFEDVNCIEIGFTNQGTYYIDDIAVEP